MSNQTALWLGTFRLRPDLRNPEVWTDKETQAVGDHFARLKDAAAEGVVLFAGRTDDRDGRDWLAEDTIGLVVFEASDREEAENFMAEDPAVRSSVMTSTVQSYRLAAARDASA